MNRSVRTRRLRLPGLILGMVAACMAAAASTAASAPTPGVNLHRAALAEKAAAAPVPARLASPTAAQRARRPWLAAAQTPMQRADELLEQMTLPEKVDLMTGDQGAAPYAYYNAAIPQLGIPALKMADAGSGVASRGWSLARTGNTATAMPSMQALGATWDVPIVSSYAKTVADEVLDTGQNVLLGPDLDLTTNPWWGRIGETVGEDPILTADMTAPYVRQVQSEGVIATLKHYAAYNQETNRGFGQNDIVDQRTLREVYTLAYGAVDQQADPGAVMCSFNQINSEYSCENRSTLGVLLETRLRFDGFVLTDFGAIHDTVPSLNAGTDMETGTTTIYGPALLNAVVTGEVPTSLLDAACLRILSTMFRIGLFDQAYSVHPIRVAADDRTALNTEEQAITLLKNANHTLPLSPTTKSITVVGADANFLAAPSGSPYVYPTKSTTVLQGILARAGSASVNWVPGNDPVNAASMLETPDMTTVPSSVLSPTNGVGTGLETYYWNNPTFQGSPSTIRVEKQVNYDSGFLSDFSGWTGATSQVPVPPGGDSSVLQSAVYDGHITAPATGDYSLALTGYGDATLTLDGQQIITMTGADQTRSYAASATLHLIAGQTHTLHITYESDHVYSPGLEPGSLLLEWSTPAGAQSPAIQQAAAAAAKTQDAIVFVRTYESEQRDRVSLHLPQSADELIEAVAAANPHTIVVLANSGPVTMPWLGDVPAVVETYFGGQEQGAALAHVLWGDVDPSGKLTVTYPTSETAVPVGVNNPWATSDSLNVLYGQGISVGYKGYDNAGITPLFPFGYGLSYTGFGYSDLSVTPTGNPANSPISVQFQITNTGQQAGSEVAEVYLGLPAATGEPPRRLVGFTKVSIAPGGTASAQVTINPNDGTHPLGYYDTDLAKWVVAPGTYTVSVGGSERSTPLVGSFTVPGSPVAAASVRQAPLR
jgi:beta-glucosidase